jgi:hypothetical protein
MSEICVFVSSALLPGDCLGFNEVMRCFEASIKSAKSKLFLVVKIDSNVFFFIFNCNDFIVLLVLFFCKPLYEPSENDFMYVCTTELKQLNFVETLQ